MAKNKLTLLMDGGYLLMSRLFAHEKGFSVDNTPRQKEMTAAAFQETMARTVIKIINQFPEIDNLIITSEGGSWRKNVPIPGSISGVTYKGHRTKKKELDWDAIYKAYNQFIENCHNIGINCPIHSAIEGDDWAWYWSRRLNAEGTSVLIWTSDCDLKQLVQTDGAAFTGWYNDKVGLVLPENCSWPEDPFEAMMNPPFQTEILTRICKHAHKYECINPDQIVINKVLCGDSGDNIKAIVRYQKGGRTYRFSEKDYEKLINALNIKKLSDMLDTPDTVIRAIIEDKKFAPYHIPYEEVAEMLDYNLKMVWLNEVAIPETVLSAMVQTEYVDFDVNIIRNNYRLMLEKDSSIENIFNELGV